MILIVWYLPYMASLTVLFTHKNMPCLLRSAADASMRYYFCLACVNNMMNGPLSCDDSYSVARCNTATNNLENNPASNMHCYHKNNCTKMLAPGVQMQVWINRNHRNNIASSLAVGNWVLLDRNKDRVEPI